MYDQAEDADDREKHRHGPDQHHPELVPWRQRLVRPVGSGRPLLSGQVDRIFFRVAVKIRGQNG